MRKIRQSRSSKSIYKYFLLVLLFPVIFFLHQYFLVIRQVICQTNAGACPPSLTANLSERLGRSMIFFDRQELIKKINEDFGPNSIEIKISLPGTVIIKLDFSGSEIPIQLIVSDYLSGQVIDESSINLLQDFIASNTATPKKITTDGRLLDTTLNSNLFLISKETTKETIVNIAQGIQLLQLAKISYTKGFILPPNLILVLNTNQLVIFSLSESIKAQILSLQQLLRAATIGNSRLIDLRFNRPIIK
jgi:hypothetical protein